MARPLRIEFPGAVFHVISRGDRREPIFVDDVRYPHGGQQGQVLPFAPKSVIGRAEANEVLLSD